MKSQTAPEAKVAIAFSALLLIAASGVALVPGIDGVVRRGLAFAFEQHAPSPRDAAAIFAANVRLLAIPVVAGSVVSKLGRCAADALVVVMLTPSAVMIGVALGAYGSRLLPWLPHLPLEITALSLSTGLYMRTRRTATMPSRTRHVWQLAIAAGLLAVSALIEVYLAPIDS